MSNTRYGSPVPINNEVFLYSHSGGAGLRSRSQSRLPLDTWVRSKVSPDGAPPDLRGAISLPPTRRAGSVCTHSPLHSALFPLAGLPLPQKPSARLQVHAVLAQFSFVKYLKKAGMRSLGSYVSEGQEGPHPRSQETGKESSTVTGGR